MSDDLTTDAVPSAPAPVNSENGNAEEIKNETPETQTKQEKPKRHKNKDRSKKIKPENIVMNVKSKNFVMGSVSNITYNLFANDTSKDTSANVQSEPPIKETKYISALLDSRLPVNDEQLKFVAKNLGSNWKNVIKELLVASEENSEAPVDSDARISQFYEEHISSGLAEVIQQLLFDWKEDQGSQAKVGHLAQSLWKHNERKVVKIWSNKPELCS